MKVFVSPSHPDTSEGFCDTDTGELLLPIRCDCSDDYCDALIFVGAESGETSMLAEVVERADLDPHTHAAALVSIFLEVEEDRHPVDQLAHVLHRHLALVVLGV